jgi:hypothetical protein
MFYIQDNSTSNSYSKNTETKHIGILVHENKDLQDVISHARSLGFRVGIYATAYPVDIV